LTWPSWVVLSWFLLLTAVQIWIMARLIRAFRESSTPPTDAAAFPRALAVLCLRGSDPFLRECLTRLTSMDYPDYRLRLVIDSETDPVIPEVQEFLATKPRIPVEVLYLGTRRPHCSGKVCGMLRGTEDLDDQIGIVAIFDGDALVHPSCLRELVAPLADPTVGLTSGNRWYVPKSLRMGTLVRASWNSYAMGVMNVVGIPWGGCMALRASDFRDPEYRKTLEVAFGEDSTTATFMRRRGKAIRFVSDATILNPEETSYKGLYNFLVRQLLTVWLCNPRWLFVYLHNLTLNTTLMLGYLLFLAPTIRTVSVIGYFTLFTMAVVESFVAFLLVKQSVARRGVAVPFLTWAQVVTWPVWGVATNLTSLISTLHCPLVKEHLWRGVTYRLGGKPPATVVHVAPMGGGPQGAAGPLQK
jgi:cellulose synthase/poly-beta-1,6-N-acetylglucosamine synthase-like glycosyltransferase